MTSYDREETFGVYFAVLKKGEPSPLLPESDEDPGVGNAPPGGGGGGGRGGRGASTGSGQSASTGSGQAPDAADDQAAAPAARAPRVPVTVQIDFDGLQQRIISVPGVPNGSTAN